MGIADIRSALTTALAPLGKVSNARMGYLGGGKFQRITFTLTRNGMASAQELLVPGGTAFEPALITALQEFVANFPQEDQGTP